MHLQYSRIFNTYAFFNKCVLKIRLLYVYFYNTYLLAVRICAHVQSILVCMAIYYIYGGLSAFFFLLFCMW